MAEKAVPSLRGHITSVSVSEKSEKLSFEEITGVSAHKGFLRSVWFKIAVAVCGLGVVFAAFRYRCVRTL